MTKVSEKCPLDRDLLVRDDCFILDNGANGKIFVWKGESRHTSCRQQWEFEEVCFDHVIKLDSKRIEFSLGILIGEEGAVCCGFFRLLTPPVPE